MGSNPSHFIDCDECPVENVSWDDVQDFIRKLNAQTGKNYRLPTEAEWEYAAKGGLTYSGSNDRNDSLFLNSVVWNKDNSGGTTHPVGRKQANELGIYDMIGNVEEWCSDWHGTYNSYSETNPTGASLGSDRVTRGGNWGTDAYDCNAERRHWSSPHNHNRYYRYGFRLVLPVE